MNKNTDEFFDKAAELASELSAMSTGTSASHLFVYGTRAPTKRIKAILHLCDGDVPTCRKDECYKRGGECRHTTDATHALNQEPRSLVPDEQGNLWETSPES